MKPFLALGTLFAAALLFAQSATTYDSSRQVKLSGVVTRVEWANPHAFFFLNVRDAAGTVANWALEFGNPLDLEKEGWTQNSLHIGDSVTVEGIPARAAARQAFAKSVILTKTGKRLFTAAAKKAAPTTHEPTPRWPDGQPRLGPPPGKKGYWGAPSSTVLYESSAGKIQMDENGLLKNLSDVDRVAPFQPWAKAVYEFRQRTLLKDDPLARCLPPGGPRQFQMAHGFQFVEQRELGRILLLLGGGDRNWRVIYTDGRPQGQADEVVRGYYGNSVGRWEKDTLVVDVIGFNEHFWFTNGGLPHTEALHLTERFTRPELGRLKYDLTVDDPRTYTRPWNGGWTVAWVPNEEIQEFFCEENVEATLPTNASGKENYK